MSLYNNSFRLKYLLDKAIEAKRQVSKYKVDDVVIK